MVVFTKHVLRRMRERGITRAQVVSAVREPGRVSKGNGDVKLLQKRYGNRILEVVMEIEKDKTLVITGYWL